MSCFEGLRVVVAFYTSWSHLPSAGIIGTVERAQGLMLTRQAGCLPTELSLASRSHLFFIKIIFTCVFMGGPCALTVK